MQGFEAIVDTKDDYPIRSRGNILIRPGHLVTNNIYILRANSNDTLLSAE